MTSLDGTGSVSDDRVSGFSKNLDPLYSGGIVVKTL